jgi:hypothetical protein
MYLPNAGQMFEPAVKVWMNEKSYHPAGIIQTEAEGHPYKSQTLYNHCAFFVVI